MFRHLCGVCVCNIYIHTYIILLGSRISYIPEGVSVHLLAGGSKQWLALQHSTWMRQAVEED